MPEEKQEFRDPETVISNNSSEDQPLTRAQETQLAQLAGAGGQGIAILLKFGRMTDGEPSFNELMLKVSKIEIPIRNVYSQQIKIPS